MSDGQMSNEYTQIAALVAGYVDDKLNERDHEYMELFQRLNGVAQGLHEDVERMNRRVDRLQATIGGLRDAVGKLQHQEGNVPEHLYRNFIRSEAERLKFIKRKVGGDGES